MDPESPRAASSSPLAILAVGGWSIATLLCFALGQPRIGYGLAIGGLVTSTGVAALRAQRVRRAAFRGAPRPVPTSLSR